MTATAEAGTTIAPDQIIAHADEHDLEPTEAGYPEHGQARCAQ
jgi:hypothetical protein